MTQREAILARRRNAQSDAANEATDGRKLTPADDATGTEDEARLRQERENTPENAKTAKDLLTATIDGLDQLTMVFGRRKKTAELCCVIESRIRRYLEQNNEPSVYAEALTQEEERDEDTKLALAETEAHIRAELNPLLFQLQISIGKNNNLLELLTTGRVGAQKTRTLFHELSGLSVEKPEAEKGKLVLIDPLNTNEDNITYWRERVTNEKYIAGFIGNRSAYAAIMLKDLAKETKDESLRKACTIIVKWIDQTQAGMGSNLSLEGLRESVSRLDFLHARDTKEPFRVINALQEIKSAEPLLYTSLLGTGPRYESAEAGRSDLFGNVVQIALQRTLEILPQWRKTFGEDEDGLTLLDQQCHELLNMADTTAMPLLYLDEERMAVLMEHTSMRTAEEIQRDPKMAGMLMPMVMGALFHMDKSAKLKAVMEKISAKEYNDTLEKINSGTMEEFFAVVRSIPTSRLESDRLLKKTVERRTLAFLSVAAPDEFIRIIQETPEDMLASEEFSAVIERRLAPALPDPSLPQGHPRRGTYRINISSCHGDVARKAYNEKNLPIGGYEAIDGIRKIPITRRDRIIYRLFDRRGGYVREQEKEEERNLRMVLWETAPDETLLCEEFYRNWCDLIEKIMENMSNYKMAHKFYEPMARVAAAHPQIPAEKWAQWVEANKRYFLGMDDAFSRRVYFYRQTTFEDVMEGPSALHRIGSKYIQEQHEGRWKEEKMTEADRINREVFLFRTRDADSSGQKIHDYVGHIVNMLREGTNIIPIIDKLTDQEKTDYLLMLLTSLVEIDIYNHDENERIISFSNLAMKCDNLYSIVHLLRLCDRYLSNNANYRKICTNIEAKKHLTPTDYPRFQKDEHGRWQVDVWDEKKKEWVRQVQWRDYEVAETREYEGGEELIRIDDQKYLTKDSQLVGPISVRDNAGKVIYRIEPAPGGFKAIIVHESKIITGSWNGRMNVWDPTDGACEATIDVEDGIDRIIPAKDGTIFLATKKRVGDTNVFKTKIIRVDLETKEIVTITEGDDIGDFQLLENDRLLLLKRHGLEIFDPEKKNKPQSLGEDALQKMDTSLPWPYGDRDIISNDKYIIISRRHDGSFIILDKQTCQPIITENELPKFGGKNPFITSDGLLALSFDDTINFYDMGSWRCVHHLRVPEGKIHTMMETGDHKILADVGITHPPTPPSGNYTVSYILQVLEEKK
ncbi:MAG: hypothetical protein WC752_01105 [Patescibacteria group bacterium]|jgi:hypothetical protein